MLQLGTETIRPGAFVYVLVYAVRRHEEFWNRHPDFIKQPGWHAAFWLRGSSSAIRFGVKPSCVRVAGSSCQASPNAATL